MKTSNSNQKHYRSNVIVAWAEGKEIQFKYNDDEWQDYTAGCSAIPAFNSLDLEWRIKPKTVTRRFRMAVIDTDLTGEVVCALDTTNSYVDDYVKYDFPGFVRWVGDSVDVELEVNNE